jgi:Flp pilus assembly protein TadD
MKALGLRTLAAIAALSAAGCKEMDNPAFAPGDQPLPTAEQVVAGPPTQPGPEQPLVDKAKAHFKNGEYGLAERYFRQAIELRHRNLEAWLGLAASLDHLKRFDEADRAYGVLQKMVGATPTVLNNLGYHYMLKGEFGSAEHALLTAQSKDPNNPAIRDNLILLADWRAAAGRT